MSLLNMYIQSSDINNIESILQDHVKQIDMLIILGDFTGLSQSEGIRIFCMLLMISMYKRKGLLFCWDSWVGMNVHYCVINFLQIAPLLSAL